MLLNLLQYRYLILSDFHEMSYCLGNKSRCPLLDSKSEWTCVAFEVDTSEIMLKLVERYHEVALATRNCVEFDTTDRLVMRRWLIYSMSELSYRQHSLFAFTAHSARSTYRSDIHTFS